MGLVFFDIHLLINKISQKKEIFSRKSTFSRTFAFTIGIDWCTLGFDTTYQQHGQTIHSTNILFSPNLFKIPGVLTWAWLILTSEVIEAVRGHKWPKSFLGRVKKLEGVNLWNTYLMKVAHQPQKPFSGSNQVWAGTSGKKDRGQCSKSWGCMIQQHSQNTTHCLEWLE